jgi:hypothetical protein
MVHFIGTKPVADSLAYNMFRLASITQVIAKRVVDGSVSSALARAMGASTRPLAQLAGQLTRALR